MPKKPAIKTAQWICAINMDHEGVSMTLDVYVDPSQKTLFAIDRYEAETAPGTTIPSLYHENVRLKMEEPGNSH